VFFSLGLYLDSPSHHQVRGLQYRRYVTIFLLFVPTSSQMIVRFVNCRLCFSFHSFIPAFLKMRTYSCRMRFYTFISAQIYSLLSVVLLSLFISSLSTPVDQDVEQVHASLAEFLLRGQLVVETFAPISFLLRNTCQGSCPHVLLSLGLLMGSISVFNAMERAIVITDDSLKCKRFRQILGIVIAPCLVCFTIPYVEGDISSTFTLKRARDVADCLLIMSVAILFCRQRTTLLVSEVLLFIGLLLGCDPLDFLLCFLNVQFQRAIRAFKKYPILIYIW